MISVGRVNPGVVRTQFSYWCSDPRIRHEQREPRVSRLLGTQRRHGVVDHSMRLVQPIYRVHRGQPVPCADLLRRGAARLEGEGGGGGGGGS